MHKGDVEELETQGMSWGKKVAFGFTYIAARVHCRIPPAIILHSRMKAVYEFFRDKVDSKTGLPVFNARENRIRTSDSKGWISDGPNRGVNVHVCTKDR